MRKQRSREPCSYRGGGEVVFPPVLETLESRTLLSAVVPLSLSGIDLIYEEGPQIGQPFAGGWIKFKITSYDMGTIYAQPGPAGYSGNPSPAGEAAGVAALDPLDLLSSPAAQNLGPYESPVGSGQTKEDTWGIFRVTEIDTLSHVRLWSPAGKGYELSGVFFGEQDIYTEPMDAGNQRIDGVGLTLELYRNNDGDFLTAAALGTAGRLPGGGFSLISDGILELSATSLPGFINPTGVAAGLATQFETRFNGVTNTGDGESYMEFTGGNSYDRFNSDSIVSASAADLTTLGLDTAADLQIAYQMFPAVVADWLVVNDDPVLAYYTPFVARPGIDIEKATNGEDADTPTGPAINVGDPVTWTYVVTNTGNVPLSNVVVVDDNGTPGNPGDDFSPTFTGGDTNNNSQLDTTETWTYTAQGIAVVGQYANNAVVTGSFENTPVTDEDPSHYIGVIPPQPGIDIEKATNGEDADTPTGPAINVGDPVTWTYVVTNTGNVPLSNVVVVDDNGTPGNLLDDFSPTFVGGDTNNDGLLDTDETWTYTAAGIAVVGQYANNAVVTGQFEDTPVTDQDPSHYIGVIPPRPGIDIEKATNGQDADTPTGPEILVGGLVTWTYVVTNTGNVPLSNVVVVDDNGTPGNLLDDFSPTFVGGDVNNNGLLETTEVWTYSASGAAVAGQYANMAVVTGKFGDTVVTDQDPSHYFGKVPTGGQGLTPGFWKQTQHFQFWVGFTPDQSYNAVFGVSDPDGGALTLLGALERGGGSYKALGRHAVAALLNASNPNISFFYTPAQVIALVQQAYTSGDFETIKNLLAAQNELENVSLTSTTTTTTTTSTTPPTSPSPKPKKH